MLSLEEQSFKNHVTFFRDELLHIYDTGERGKYEIKKTWKIINYMYKDGKTILTPRAIAVLCGLWEIDKIDEDIGEVRLVSLKYSMMK